MHGPSPYLRRAGRPVPHENALVSALTTLDTTLTLV